MEERYGPAMRSGGCSVDIAWSGDRALEMAADGDYDLVVVDLAAFTETLDLVEAIGRADPRVVVIAVAGRSAGDGMEAVKRGAYDFVEEPFPPERLMVVVTRGLEKRRLSDEVRTLDSTLKAMAGEQEGCEGARSRFVTMVAHELRAPLAAVEGYLSAYLTGAAGTDPELNRRMLERARQRTHSLLDLVNDLLQYNRLESPRIDRKRELLNMVDMIADTMELMKTEGESRGLTFETHFQESLPLIEANRTEMEQLLTNLISNAIKYNVTKGKVEVSAKSLERAIEVKVTDTGIGIGKEDLLFIFEEFYRASGPQTRYTTGTGLGLSIVKRIVDAYCGLIEVESIPGRGTTFAVMLPVSAGRPSRDDGEKGKGKEDSVHSGS